MLDIDLFAGNFGDDFHQFIYRNVFRASDVNCSL